MRHKLIKYIILFNAVTLSLATAIDAIANTSKVTAEIEMAYFLKNPDKDSHCVPAQAGAIF